MLVVLLSVVAGLVAHLGVFIRGEWHLKIRSIVFTHSALALATFWALRYWGHAFTIALQTLFQITGCYLATLFTSMSVYRYFFHPLSKFSGPKLAALTKFWHVYKSRNSKNFRVMDEVYKKYGTIVRTGKPLTNLRGSIS